MKKTKLSEILFWAGLIAFIGMVLLTVDLRYGRISDSLLKVIQSRSLIENGFQSEELIYPARNLDPDFNHYVFRNVFHVRIGERNLGQYPVFLSAFLAPFTIFPGMDYLAHISVLIYLAALLFLRYWWKLSIPAMIFAALATYYLPASLDVSEHPLFILLNIFGTSFFLKGMEKEKIGYLIIGGMLNGLSVWLRLEAIPYMAVLLGVTLILYGIRSKKQWMNVVTGGLAFSLIVVLFFIFNYVDYGHIMGPRFFQNFHPGTTSLATRLKRFLVIAFYGGFKVGFFLYIPLFLVLTIYYAIPRNFLKLERNYKVLFVTGIAFLVLAAWIAPNDGVTNFGPRYVELSIFPFLPLLGGFWNDTLRNGSKVIRILWRSVNGILVTFSILITLFGIAIYKTSADQLKEHQRFFNSTKSDIWVFDRKSCGFMGMEYFNKKIVCVASTKRLNDLISRMHEEEPGKRFAYFQYINRDVCKKDKKDLDCSFMKSSGAYKFNKYNKISNSVFDRFKKEFPVQETGSQEIVKYTVFQIPEN